MYFKIQVYLFYIFTVLNFILYFFTKKDFEFYYAKIKDSSIRDSFFEVIIFSIIYFIISYFFIRDKKIVVNIKKIVVNKKKMEVFIGFMMLVNAILFLTGNSQKAGHIYVNSISIINNFISIDLIILYYYLMYREKNRKIFSLFNTYLIIYFAYNFLSGWTGFIIAYFSYELYFYSKKKGGVKTFLKNYILVYFVLGGIAYSIAYPLKFYIRFGYTGERLKILDGLQKLIERSSPIKSYFFYNENIYKIINKYPNKAYEMIQEQIFQPIPRILFPQKPIYFNLNQEIEAIRLGWQTVSNNDITYLGTLKYYYNTSVIFLFLHVIITVVILILLKKILEKFFIKEIKMIIMTSHLIYLLISGKQLTLSIIISNFSLYIILYCLRDRGDEYVKKNMYFSK